MRGRSSLGRRVRNRWVCRIEGGWVEWWTGVRNTLPLLDNRSDYQSEMTVRMNVLMILYPRRIAANRKPNPQTDGIAERYTDCAL